MSVEQRSRRASLGRVSPDGASGRRVRSKVDLEQLEQDKENILPQVEGRRNLHKLTEALNDTPSKRYSVMERRKRYVVVSSWMSLLIFYQ